MEHVIGPAQSYAVGIFLCPAAGEKSNWKSRFLPDISNRPRYIKLRCPKHFGTASVASASWLSGKDKIAQETGRHGIFLS